MENFKERDRLEYRSTWEDNIKMCLNIEGARGGIVVKALRYKPAGRGFDSRWCHLNFSVDSASNRNEYQVYFLGVKAAGA